MKSHIRYAEKAGKHLSLYSLIGRGRAFSTDSIYNVGWQTNWAMLLIFTVSSCSVLYYTDPLSNWDLFFKIAKKKKKDFSLNVLKMKLWLHGIFERDNHLTTLPPSLLQDREQMLSWLSAQLLLQTPIIDFFKNLLLLFIIRYSRGKSIFLI